MKHASFVLFYGTSADGVNSVYFVRIDNRQLFVFSITNGRMEGCLLFPRVGA